MSFLYPAFLWGLTALLIPVIIHLFNFRKHKTVYFSQTKFLESVEKDTRSKTNLKQILILISRMLLIAALVFAFARPVILPDDETEKQQKIEYVAVYIDNSYSMQNEGKKSSLMEIAKQKSIKIAEAYGENVKFLLLTNDMPPEHYRAMNYEKFLEEAGKINVSAAESKLSETIEKLKSAFYNINNKNIPFYIISDFQKSGIDFGKIEKPDFADINAVLISAVKNENLSIDSVWFESPFRQRGRSDNLNVLITNHGKESFTDIPVRLRINDSLRAVSSVNIESGNNTAANLVFSNQGDGIQEAKVSIDDYPVRFDNDFYFTYELDKKKSVLIVNGKNSKQFPRQVYEDSTYFKLRETDYDLLDLSSLGDYDLIILNGIKEITEGLAASLSKGKSASVLLIPGKKMIKNKWNKFLRSINGPVFGEWDSSINKISQPSWEHPFFEGVFPDKQTEAEMPRVNGSYIMKSNPGSRTEKLIEFVAGTSFLDMIKSEDNLYYVFSKPIGSKKDNFIRHPLFLPVAYNIAINTYSDKNLYNISGKQQSVFSEIESAEDESTVEIRCDQEKALIPSYRNTGKGLRLFIPDALNEAGHFDVFYNNNKIDAFALNTSPEESEMEFYNSEKLREKANTGNFKIDNIIESDVMDVSSEIKESKEGKELWPYFLIAALLFIIAEILLIRLIR